ncbi:hypothetical protein EYC84_008296 [Monilinia fructicola]|uniref:Uncharacterized protein n=1 Tax=Monilinia fructicola TaxID=38448 RepID=A0A5M9JEV5_MONFR|nr:hypothetical protein EYC84_008296 [Monilinia fructicola]
MIDDRTNAHSFLLITNEIVKNYTTGEVRLFTWYCPPREKSKQGLAWTTGYLQAVATSPPITRKICDNQHSRIPSSCAISSS